jgi:integrase
MPDLRLLLTDKSIGGLPLAGTGQYKARDNELTGFLVLIGKRSKTFMVQGEFWREGTREFSTRTKIGEFGILSTREARAKAKSALALIAQGIKPGEATKPGLGEITLRQAWERYRDAHMVRKGRSLGTIENFRDHLERLLKDWLDRPLGRLGRSPKLVSERHDEITKANGPYIANGCMRSLRAIYNHALKNFPELPSVNPVGAIDWNKEARRDTGMGLQDIPKWLSELYSLSNGIRREFHLLTLLSGSRPDALKQIKIEDLDLRRRILHIPMPKGGQKKAFDVPLSRLMMRSIIRTIRMGRILHGEMAGIWLYPADSGSGHLSAHKEKRDSLSKYGNDLRQSYRTIAQVAAVSELDVHLLMNHSLPGVNAGYITRGKLLDDHLRGQQELISRAILNCALKFHEGADNKIFQWLQSEKFRTTSPLDPC